MNTERLHLLIVEDEEAHVEAIRRAFDVAGVKTDIHAAGTLREYREYVAAHPPDLAMIDLNLPDGRAVEVLTNPPEDEPFPVLVMTAFGNQEIVVQVMKAGALDYVVKSPENFAAMPQITERVFREWKLLQKHKQAEEALRESEERYRGVFAGIPDGIIVHDADGLIHDANEVMAQRLEIPREALLGRRIARFVTPDNAANIVDNARITLAGQSHAFETTYVSASGKTIPAEVHERRIQWRNGQAVLSISRDITERKRGEENLRKSNLDLQAALLQVRNTQAQMVREERLAALGQMASGIAHDFNNVLVPIVGLSEMLLSQPETLSNRDEALSMIKDISAAALDAKQIVKRLRLIQVSEDEGEYVPVDVNEIVRNAVEMTKPRWDKELGAKGVQIAIVTPLKADQQVMGDASQLREALMNLIFNAVDAMPKGGPLTISSAVENEEVVVAISDTGTGMTDAAKERCLEPFFTTKGVKGTGLGLSMVHGIVIRHDGTMEIDSTLGKGTTIRIRLPRAPAEPIAEEPKKGKAEEEFKIAPLRILVADDEAGSRHLIERLLTRDGHVVVKARTGREAIEKASIMTFDLVITDRSMPEGNGDLVAHAVKARTPETPVILLTGFGGIMQDDGERPEGVDLILCKPLTRDELQRGIMKTMAGKRRTP